MANPARTYRSIVTFGLAAGAAVAACNNTPEAEVISVAPSYGCNPALGSYTGCEAGSVPDARAKADAQIGDADASSDASDDGGDADTDADTDASDAASD